MTYQTTIEFETIAPVNTERLRGQNLRLYYHLLAGNKIHCFSPAMKTLRIGYLNSRISDLRKANVEVKKQWIKVKDAEGEDVSVVEYSILK